MRQWAEFSLPVLALTIVIVAGGIDLSVGSTFALGNIVALALLNVAGWSMPAVVAGTLATGAFVGLVNGVLVGYLRLHAFLTLIIVRAVVDMLLLNYSVKIAGGFIDSDPWNFLGEGSILGTPFSIVVTITLPVILHLVLSRTRIGWYILAIGESRRSAHNVGIPVRKVVCA
ncbi:MAG: ABC transporter permease, partial [Rhizobiaceae bacterium]|nr:ABC transporter permease [Rhizobiaceae bacterium]